MTDSDFLLKEIHANEKWNSHGISEQDLSVLFEMSHLCDYGSSKSFSHKRFKEALDGLDPARVKRVGDYWYTIRSAPSTVRVCQAPKCDKVINHRREGVLYCSDRCKTKAKGIE